MASLKLPRLAVNWAGQPEMLRRYWDTAMNTLEAFSKPVVVEELPANPSVTRRIVSDATSTAFNDVVVGSGSNTVPVFYDGTNWRIG